MLYHYLIFYDAANVVLWCKLWDGHHLHTLVHCWIEYPIETVDVKEGQYTQQHLLSFC